MTGIIWNFLSFIVALGILIAVHEFGHFWVARRCGVKVERFSIGFGKAIWSKQGKDGTLYTLSLIPLGGFVKMLDSRVANVAESDKAFSYDHKPTYQRAMIVAAGPVFNFIFAIFAYFVVFIVGVPTVKPVIGEVAPQSIVAQAGLQPGWQVTKVSGVETLSWESVNMALVSHIGDDALTLTVAEPDFPLNSKQLQVDLHDWNFDPETQSPMRSLGFTPYSPQPDLMISQIVPGGAAEKSGFLVKDHIVEINGSPVTTWASVVEQVKASPNVPLDVVVLRNGQRINLTLEPEGRKNNDGQLIGFAGIAPTVGDWPDGYKFDMQYGPIDSLIKSIEKTGQLVELTASMLKKLVVGDVGLNNLSGPISIAKGAGATADYGFVYFLGFLALISVNLGIINLVPLPMLDGGHLLFLAVEAVIRRPVPEKVQEYGYRIGGAIIFSMMAIAIFNDFTRL
jgi:regulator of sigma E protease